MADIKKRLIVEVASLAVFLVIMIVIYPMLSKRMSRKSAFDYWEAEQEAHNRRLFGEAWKDV